MIRDRETLNLLLDNVARFVRDQLIPNEPVVAETDEIPEDVVDGMKAMGLFGLTIPEKYGGLELTMEEEVLAMFELGRASPAFRSLIGTTVGIGSQGILLDGTEAQKRCYLPRLATGEIIAMTQAKAAQIDLVSHPIGRAREVTQRNQGGDQARNRRSGKTGTPHQLGVRQRMRVAAKCSEKFQGTRERHRTAVVDRRDRNRGRGFDAQSARQRTQGSCAVTQGIRAAA